MTRQSTMMKRPWTGSTVRCGGLAQLADAVQCRGALSSGELLGLPVAMAEHPARLHQLLHVALQRALFVDVGRAQDRKESRFPFPQVARQPVEESRPPSLQRRESLREV